MHFVLVFDVSSPSNYTFWISLRITPHYENMPMQYTAIFHGLKSDSFQMKIYDIFLIFAQNIDFGYTLEPLLRRF